MDATYYQLLIKLLQALCNGYEGDTEAVCPMYAKRQKTGHLSL